MMKIKTFLFLMCVVLCNNVNAQVENEIANISNYLEELSQDKMFGASVAILKNDKFVLQKAYGYANRAHQVHNKVNTPFNLASIGKIFTAVAILQLYEEGKLDLNIPVGKYIPDFPNQGIQDSVTIHQLLTHSSGLPLWFSKDFLMLPKSAYLELEDYLPFYEKIFIDKNKVGTKSYSNVGFCLLGFIIESVSKMTYRDYIQQYIFKPAKMDDSGIWSLVEIIPNAAVGYVRPSGKDDYWKTNYHLNMSANPAGGGYASAIDLVNFFAALNKNKLIREQTKTMMFSQQIESEYPYGYGIAIDENNGYEILGHEGGFFGVRGELKWYKDKDYIVVILTNSDQTDYIDVSAFVRKELTGTKEQKMIYDKTQKLIKKIIGEELMVNEGNLKHLSKDKYDEGLIQIKGYHFLNNKNTKMAERLFKLNVILFPNSTQAKNDLKRVENW